MSDAAKDRVKKILDRLAEKELKTIAKLNGTAKKRKNEKPEKLVEKACVDWMRNQGWKVEIYESKATQVNGIWRNQAIKAGTPDCQGVTPDGLAIAVEFKAKGKLKTFTNPKNYRQQEFIKSRINMGAFAAVVDDVETLKKIYEEWEIKRRIEPQLAKLFLLKCLP